MTWRRCNHGFVAAVDHHSWFSCLPGYNSRIHLHHYRLFRAKTASDPRLDHTDLGLTGMEGMGQNTAHMEGNLGRCNHIQAIVNIHVCVSTECLHHGLLVRLGVVSSGKNHVTVLHHLIYIPVLIQFMGTEIPLIICSCREIQMPVFLWMYQDRIVFRRMEIQYRFQHLIVHFQHL